MFEVKNLTVSLQSKNGKTYHLVNDLSYELKAGKTLAIVGESGCGKTMQSLAIMGVLPPNIKVTKGEILFKGENILKLSPQERRKINGEKIALIFQDALTALNPVMSIREHFLEVFADKTQLYLDEAEEEISELLKQVELPERVLTSYPHQLSGGQRQRVLIALALALNPRLLIADEPTTALDTNTQNQILRLIKKLQRQRSMAVIFITHDLSLAQDIADKILVLYSGRKVEEAKAKDLFQDPLHPYTFGLLRAMITEATDRTRFLYEIKGMPLSKNQKVVGCSFRNRCIKFSHLCSKFIPPLEELFPKHYCACFWAKNWYKRRGKDEK